MALELCPRCGWLHYGTDPCRPKRATVPKKSFFQRYSEVIEQMPRTKSTAARKVVSTRKASQPANDAGSGGADAGGLEAASLKSAGTQAPPVDTNPGKPETKSTGNVGGSAGRSHSSLALPTESPASVPVDPPTPARGRPKVHPDRKAYKAEKERVRRAKRAAAP